MELWKKIVLTHCSDVLGLQTGTPQAEGFK